MASLRLYHELFSSRFLKYLFFTGCYCFRCAAAPLVHSQRISDLLLDVTWGSGPTIINRHLSHEEKSQYLKAGYRVRIMK